MAKIDTPESPEFVGEPSLDGRASRRVPRHRAPASIRGVLRSWTTLWWTVTVLSGVGFFFLTTHGTWSIAYNRPEAGFAGDFFVAQARALLHGHLQVSPTQLPGECFLHSGQCYGYFGITPSVLRLPVLPLATSLNTSFTPLYMTLALSLAVGSILGILATQCRSAIRSHPALTWAVALAVGPASALILISRPAVYEEAIAWSVGFIALAALCFIRWWRAQRYGWALGCCAALVLAGNARPTAVPVAVLFGVIMAGRALQTRRRFLAIVLPAAVALVPVVATFAVFWWKFGTIVPNLLTNQQYQTAPWWISILNTNGHKTASISFIPTTLFAYLRPDAVRFVGSFPFVAFRFQTVLPITYVGIPAGSLYIEPVSSITDSMPLAILFLVVSGALLRRSKMIATNAALLFALLASASALALTLSTVAITNRYVGDFYPTAALLLVLGLRLLIACPLRWRNAAMLASLSWGLVLWSVLVNWSLIYREWWS